MSTFGLIIPGRPVDTNFQQVDSNKFLATIPNADSINHIVVFLTGALQMPPDMASCIFFSMPDPNASPKWHYLGYLTNDKQSSIFRLTNLTQPKTMGNNCMLALTNGVQTPSGPAFNYTQEPVLKVAQIGISVEPISYVAQMVPEVETSATKANSFAEFINKTVSNLYNYCLSFSRPANELISTSLFQQNNLSQQNVQYVPISTIQTWYENYTRRLNSDQNFWKTLN